MVANSSHAVRDFRSCETVSTVAAVHDFCRFHGVPKVQPAKDNDAREIDNFIGCERDFPI